MSDDKNIEKLETPNPTDTKVALNSAKKQKVKGSNRVAKWFREMRSELKKVVWPTPKQVTNNTLVALGLMAFAAVVVWGLDFGASHIFQAIIVVFGR